MCCTPIGRQYCNPGSLFSGLSPSPFQSHLQENRGHVLKPGQKDHKILVYTVREYAGPGQRQYKVNEDVVLDHSAIEFLRQAFQDTHLLCVAATPQSVSKTFAGFVILLSLERTSVLSA